MTAITDPVASAIDERIREHLDSRFADDVEVLTMSQQFRREGYVKVPDLVPADLRDEVRDEAYRLVEAHAQRIDLRLEETGDSPRFMSTVSQRAIAADGRVIPAVYHSRALTDFLGLLAREPVVTCPWEGEQFVITRQDRKGDTHGWHWGDFSFTVIWLIEAPDTRFGGQLQCIPHTDWDKSNPRVHEYLESLPIRTWPHVTGDLYFLRSDTTLHRTIPLKEDLVRIILNTCWGSERDLAKGATHETMRAMFD